MNKQSILLKAKIKYIIFLYTVNYSLKKKIGVMDMFFKRLVTSLISIKDK